MAVLDRKNSRRLNYIPYAKAFKLLHDRLDTSAEEIAVCVWNGSEDGGLRAFTNGHKLSLPERFFYQSGLPEKDELFDYTSRLMGCWFKAADIKSFNPAERFMTFEALIKRWDEREGIDPRAFVLGKIDESRLQDVVPEYGGTYASGRKGDPPVEKGMFAVSEIKKIEAEDFAEPLRPTEPKAKIIAAFPVHHDAQKNRNWWDTRIRKAKAYKISEIIAKPGRAHETTQLYPDVVAGFLVDKGYMTAPKVAAALRKHFPNCSETADRLESP